MFLFWLPLLAIGQDIIWANGRDGESLIIGNAAYTYVVVTVIKSGSEDHHLDMGRSVVGVRDGAQVAKGAREHGLQIIHRSGV
jgi:hypothetical protein